MSIKQAYKEDLQVVKYITIETINQIYPHYYSKGAVEFFVEHHNDTNILSDIEAGKVFLSVNEEGQPVGTVSIKENEIAKKYEEIMIDASLPAKRIYLKRGYREKESHIINANYGDFLCYDVMIKNAKI